MNAPEYHSNKPKSKNVIINFWRFLQEDSWQSWLVSLVLLVVLIDSWVLCGVGLDILDNCVFEHFNLTNLGIILVLLLGFA